MLLGIKGPEQWVVPVPGETTDAAFLSLLSAPVQCNRILVFRIVLIQSRDLAPLLLHEPFRISKRVV